jgi:hypothetical protein
VAVAAVAVGTNRPCPMHNPVWMQHRVISTSIFPVIFFFALRILPLGLCHFLCHKKSSSLVFWFRI